MITTSRFMEQAKSSISISTGQGVFGQPVEHISLLGPFGTPPIKIPYP
jgi:hypothetical protein